MIQPITEIPDTMVGFRAAGEVTKEDFDKVILPAVDELVKRTGKLNYMLVLDTPVSNFTLGAWWKDAILGLKNLTKWHKAAIVSDSKAIIAFTDVFSVVIPGEFKGFTHEELGKAIDWTAS